MDKSTLRRADLVTSIILMILSITGFLMALSLFQETLGKGKNWYDSAGLFPMIITALLGVCSILLFLRARKDGAKFDFISKEKAISLVKSREFKVAFFIIALLAIYIFILLPYLHYKIATFVYLFIFIATFKERNLKSLAVTGVVTIIAVAALTYGFGELALIPLP